MFPKENEEEDGTRMIEAGKSILTEDKSNEKDAAFSRLPFTT